MIGPSSTSYAIALVWRGDAVARKAATPQNNRFYRAFEELAAIGSHAEPAVYDEDVADEVREQLLVADGVLVWVDPIHQGKTRDSLDPLLCEFAGRGPWVVSAHPDPILNMGVKEVLYRTRHRWHADTHLHRTAAEFGAEFLSRLETAGPRAIQNRGNGGQGVWKAELLPEVRIRIACSTRYAAVCPKSCRCANS